MRLRKQSYKKPITVSATQPTFHVTYFLFFINATDAPLSAVQKENNTTSIAQDPKGAEDYIKEISNPNVSGKPKEDVVIETSPPRPKRKRGHPRKVKTDTPTDTVEQEIDTETPAGLVDGKRIRKPSETKTSPYKTP
jgi:hypothetical protein